MRSRGPINPFLSKMCLLFVVSFGFVFFGVRPAFAIIGSKQCTADVGSYRYAVYSVLGRGNAFDVEVWHVPSQKKIGRYRLDQITSIGSTFKVYSGHKLHFLRFQDASKHGFLSENNPAQPTRVEPNGMRTKFYADCL